MTRADCARRLLALGPLNSREFREITGWTKYQCRKTIGYLQERGELESVVRGVYSFYGGKHA